MKEKGELLTQNEEKEEKVQMNFGVQINKEESQTRGFEVGIARRQKMVSKNQYKTPSELEKTKTERGVKSIQKSLQSQQHSKDKVNLRMKLETHRGNV